MDSPLAIAERVSAPTRQSPEQEPLPRNPRYRLLDTWRGLACLLVVIFHSTLYRCEQTESVRNPTASSRLIAITNQLAIGVPMFFVISGYCISATADATRRRRRPISEYFYRRFRRIFPPYWVALAAFSLFVCLIEKAIWPGLLSSATYPISKPWRLSAWQWVGNLTLTESWRSHIVGEPTCQLLGPAWTLNYEEQFYAVTGVLLLVARRRFFLGALVVTFLTLATKAASLRFGFSTDGCFFNGYWILFAAGILAYYRLNYASARAGRSIDAFVAAVTVALLAYGVFRHRYLDTIYVFLLTGALFTVVILVLHRWDAQLCGAKWLKPLAFCGTMCYSLYLVHSPIVRCISHALFRSGITSDFATLTVTLPLCMAASLAVGAVFHLLVERRFLNPSKPAG